MTILPLIAGAVGYYWARRVGRRPWLWLLIAMVVVPTFVHVVLGALRGFFPEHFSWRP